MTTGDIAMGFILLNVLLLLALYITMRTCK